MNLTRHSFVETILNTTSALTLKCILCHYFVKTVLNDPPFPKGQWLCGTLLCKVLRYFLNTLVNLIPQIDSPGLTFGFLLKSHYGI